MNLCMNNCEVRNRNMNSRNIVMIMCVAMTMYCPRLGRATNGSVVMDVEGNPLQSNTKYHMITTGGGGLGLAIRDRRHPCPPNVVQEKDRGFPVKIFRTDGKAETIQVQSDVNFVFMAATVCVQRTVWRLSGPDGINGRRYIKTNGAMGRPGPSMVANWFKIDRVAGEGGGYKIVYCSSAVESECGDVGVFLENGRSWLALGGQSLSILFKKLNH